VYDNGIAYNQRHGLGVAGPLQLAWTPLSASAASYMPSLVVVMIRRLALEN
jgi:hypothetical protein